MARERNVWPTDDVVRLWYNQSQDSARNKTGNVYFHGGTIFSYGYHFPQAKLAKARQALKRWEGRHRQAFHAWEKMVLEVKRLEKQLP